MTEMALRITTYYAALNELACLFADRHICMADYLVQRALLYELEKETRNASIHGV